MSVIMSAADWCAKGIAARICAEIGASPAAGLSVTIGTAAKVIAPS